MWHDVAVIAAATQILFWALIAFGVFVIARLVRSWIIAGQRWGGGTPGRPRLPPADLDEDVKQADQLREDREGR